MSGRFAIIAGTGALPVALKAARPDALVFAPAGVTPDLPAESFHFERLVPFLNSLTDQGITRVALAGAMQRPRLDPALFDPLTAQMVPRLVAAMQAGDDATLREIVAIFSEFGIEVAGVDALAPELLPQAGVLTQTRPSAADEKDAERAAAIVAALGQVDVGQGAVVAQGLCLAAESLPGTDAMLDFVARTGGALRPDPAGPRGLLYKAAKPGQSRDVDLPALGLTTVQNAHAAGLGGIVWAAGDVLLLEREAMVAEADRLGLFLWARAT